MKPDSKKGPDSSSDRRSFPETHWSVVLTAGQVETPKAEEALESLCRAYWYPLYAFARRQGNSPPDAQDLTQSFFQELLEKNSVSKAKYEKGRFRSFLLAFFRKFLSHQRERKRAQKRGGQFELTALSTDTLEAATATPAAGELVRISDALDDLSSVEAILAEVVDLKYFCGFSFEEIAAMKGLSERTVRRYWTKARAYLHAALRDDALM